jgi:hypothetical protein
MVTDKSSVKSTTYKLGLYNSRIIRAKSLWIIRAYCVIILSEIYLSNELPNILMLPLIFVA